MKRSLIFLIGGVFYICLGLLWAREYNILTVHAEEIKVNFEDGYLSLMEEDQEDQPEILSDTIVYLDSLDEDKDLSDNSEDIQNNENADDVLSDSETDEETMNNDDQFRIMIVFCFGLCVGVIVGHFLTGFIK